MCVLTVLHLPRSAIAGRAGEQKKCQLLSNHFLGLSKVTETITSTSAPDILEATPKGIAVNANVPLVSHPLDSIKHSPQQMISFSASPKPDSIERSWQQAIPVSGSHNAVPVELHVPNARALSANAFAVSPKPFITLPFNAIELNGITSNAQELNATKQEKLELQKQQEVDEFEFDSFDEASSTLEESERNKPGRDDVCVRCTKENVPDDKYIFMQREKNGKPGLWFHVYEGPDYAKPKSVEPFDDNLERKTMLISEKACTNLKNRPILLPLGKPKLRKYSEECAMLQQLCHAQGTMVGPQNPKCHGETSINSTVSNSSKNETETPDEDASDGGGTDDFGGVGEAVVEAHDVKNGAHGHITSISMVIAFASFAILQPALWN